MDRITSAELGIMTFNAYFEFFKMQFMKRSGPDMCGVNGEDAARIFAETENTMFDTGVRAQSNAEHTFLALVLYKLLFDNYHVYNFDHNAYIRADRAIIQHEVGENENGDIPDDGTRPDDVDQIEVEYLKQNYWAYLPPYLSTLLGEIHHEMEERLSGSGIFHKMIDKFAYILDCLCWEFLGRVGDLRIKEKYFKLSDKDRAAIDYTGSYNVADVSLHSTLEGHKEFFTHKYFKYFIEIVQSAAVVVRGSEIEWLHRYIDSINVA